MQYNLQLPELKSCSFPGVCRPPDSSLGRTGMQADVVYNSQN